MSSLRYDCEELYERVLDIQTRAMRDNLLFNGIEEKDEENTKYVLHNFLNDQMKLEHYFQFDRVHRLSRKTPNPSRPRPIVAKFVHYRDRETVRKFSKVLKATHFGVSEQFPFEIVERRLWPKFSEAKRQGLRASLDFDKLFIEGKRWYPDSERHGGHGGHNAPNTHNAPTANPNKRARNHSSPRGQHSLDSRMTDTGDQTSPTKGSNPLEDRERVNICECVNIVYLNVCALKQDRYHNISIQCQLKLFDSIVLPVLLYVNEIWGFENLSLMEKICNGLLKSYTIIFIIWRTWTLSCTHFCKIKNDCLLITYWKTDQVIIISI